MCNQFGILGYTLTDFTSSIIVIIIFAIIFVIVVIVKGLLGIFSNFINTSYDILTLIIFCSFFFFLNLGKSSFTTLCRGHLAT